KLRWIVTKKWRSEVFMDRKQAQANIGKLIIINEGQEGSYVGVLNDVIAPPRKTWRGEVTIQAVAELPAFKDEEGQLTLPPLKYIENEVIDCIGSKLYSLENEEDHIHETYRDSILHAAKKRYL